MWKVCEGDCGGAVTLAEGDVKYPLAVMQKETVTMNLHKSLRTYITYVSTIPSSVIE